MKQSVEGETLRHLFQVDFFTTLKPISVLHERQRFLALLSSKASNSYDSFGLPQTEIKNVAFWESAEAVNRKPLTDSGKVELVY